MFGAFYLKPIINPTKIRVTGGPETQYLNGLINGTYIKNENSYYKYDYSQLDYHNMPIAYSLTGSGLPDMIDDGFCASQIFQTTFGAFMMEPDYPDNTIYIDGQLTNLTKDSKVCFLRIDLDIAPGEELVALVGHLYYNLNENPWEGTWTKYNFTKILGDDSIYVDYHNYINKEYYNDAFTTLYNKTFEQLPNTINITAVE